MSDFLLSIKGVSISEAPDATKAIPKQPEVATQEINTTPQQTEKEGGFSVDSLMDSLFKSEGGYQNNKKDKGNYYKGQLIGTNFGVSAPILAAYLGKTPTVEDMKNLTREDAKKIAKINYYDKFKIEKLPVDLREIVFHSVYLGESRGVRALQELLGVKVDGIIGPDTEAAMSNASFTKEEFKEKFLGRLKNLSSWSNFGKGWTNRFEKLASKPSPSRALDNWDGFKALESTFKVFVDVINQSGIISNPKLKAEMEKISSQFDVGATSQDLGSFRDTSVNESTTGTMLDAAPTPKGSYLIKSGDTLSSIAANNPFTLTQLIESNPHIEDPNKVEVGQYLNFPPVGVAKAGQIPAKST